jgi:anti-sigma factor RsiW
MPDCKKLDPFVTPYVDGELAAADRAEVDAHLRVCPPCHARVVIEQSVRDLLSARKQALKHECASASLRSRCTQAGSALVRARATDPGPQPRATSGPTSVVHGFSHPGAWRGRVRPLALAASLVLIVGGAFLYGITDRSNRIMAAELVADHIKCFGVNRVFNTQQQASIVEGSLASTFGWHVRLPERTDDIGLELVGARPCLYGEGRIAHIMYRHHGHPVSVFMLPKTVRPNDLIDVLGHEAAIWPSGDRTFVLVAREPREEVERMASFVHASFVGERFPNK